MNIKIDMTNNDEFFKVITNGSTLNDTLSSQIDEIVKVSEDNTQINIDPNPPQKTNPAPLDNPKSNRMGWFDNTSWDDGKRGHQF